LNPRFKTKRTREIAFFQLVMFHGARNGAAIMVRSGGPRADLGDRLADAKANRLAAS
jgi:hypothetical protein